MDIDAIAKEMPRFKRIAERMETILANPFVAGTEAERADALADLEALRKFRDELPEVHRRLESLDTMIQDVSELKNRATFDPSQIPQPVEPGASEARVKELIDESLHTSAEKLDAMSSNLEKFLAAQKDGTLPAAPDLSGIVGEVQGHVNEMLATRDEAIATLKETVASQDTKIGQLSDVIQSLSTKLDALMDALDTEQPDVGAAGAGDEATEADLTKETSTSTAAPEPPQTPQDPS